MPICINCSNPVKNLYTTYSKADDRSLGKGVRLTQCPNCKQFADKYVEHDFVVLFIDLVLIKPQVSTTPWGTRRRLSPAWSEPTDRPTGLSAPPFQPTGSLRQQIRSQYPKAWNATGPLRCLHHMGTH